MRIIAWNIRAGGGRRAEQIAGQLRRWRPDVVALSEFRATPPSRALAEALAAQGLGHQATTADPRHVAANALLVASRWPLRQARVRASFAPAARWLLVRVEAPRPLALGALHVPNRVSGLKYAFLDGLLVLARRWRGPALLAGDTNSGWIGIDEEAPAFNAREDGWMTAMEQAGWRDAFRHLHGDERAYTWYSPNGRNGFRLDEAFVNRALLPRLSDARYAWGRVDASAPRESLSDHAALIVELED